MISFNGKTVCISPSERYIRVLGKQYTLLTIGVLGNSNGLGFNEIRRSVGMPSPNLLSARLRELIGLGLVKRNGQAYALTEKGARLRELLLPLFEWIESVESGGASKF